MDELILRAEPRTVLGKQVKRLRREGRTPGVVYGPVVPEAVAVAVDTREFVKFFQTNGHSTLFTLQWDGGRQPVFVREVQVDPVRHTPVHIDFFAPNLRKELTATVPVVLHDPSPDAVGVLTTVRTEVDVRGLPTDIPHQIDASISGLVQVGDALYVSDLTMPTGVELVTAGEEMLAHLVAERAEEELLEETVAASEAAGDEPAADMVPETQNATGDGSGDEGS
ncbi:MAG: 50S ribosomal protein L25 [Chloroflexota bacterium]|nr:50S ribosomal protein L25 [Chloroflexota bacterium]